MTNVIKRRTLKDDMRCAHRPHSRCDMWRLHALRSAYRGSTPASGFGYRYMGGFYLDWRPVEILYRSCFASASHKW